MEDLDYELANPPASSLIHSLRAFGYDLCTAVSDIIDNSLTAEATRIDINFWWDGSDSYLYIVDNGRGMSTETLIQAMKPGSRSPLEKRDDRDLGRFGLGLKTASFSQAKQLTVATKLNGNLTVRKWDLDIVSETSQWRLLKTSSQQFHDEMLIKLQDVNNGTIVAWEAMDRLVPAKTSASDSKAQSNFHALIDQLKFHLEVTFHRFLSADPGYKRTRMFLQGNELVAWDPYLSTHLSHRQLGEEVIKLGGSQILVSPHILPHKSKLNDSTFNVASGPKGWNAQQGFYVYRNRRLLVAGSWLGLKHMRQEEHYKLARIQVDLPNSMDDLWEIDVKKSRAQPPAAIREDLERIARKTRSEADNVYRSRGGKLQKPGTKNITQLWTGVLQNKRISFRLNRDHPIVQHALQEGGEAVSDLLRFLEETVPASRLIVTDESESLSQTEPFEDNLTELTSLLRKRYAIMLSLGFPSHEAAKTLAHQDPFYKYPQLLSLLIEEATL